MKNQRAVKSLILAIITDICGIFCDLSAIGKAVL